MKVKCLDEGKCQKCDTLLRVVSRCVHTMVWFADHGVLGFDLRDTNHTDTLVAMRQTDSTLVTRR